MKKLTITLLFALTAVCAVSAGPALPVRPASTADELVDEIMKAGDNAEVEQIKELANRKTREACEALLEIYDHMASIYMRRAVVQGLALYDEVSGTEQMALQKMMDAATGSKEREMREIAVDQIAGCRNYGKAFLTMIVESTADDAIRERAMEHHVGSPRPEDREWYQEMYDPDDAKKSAKRKKGDVPHPLQPLRFLAFDSLVGDMEVDKVIEALEDRSRRIRVRALEELDRRDDAKALEVAEKTYKKLDAQPRDRLLAAKILMRVKGVEIAEQFLDDAMRKDAPEEFAFGLADLLVQFDDPDVNKKLLKQAGKGKGLPRIVSIRAVRHLEDPKLTKTLLKLLKDKDPRVQREAMASLAARRNADALEPLAKLIEKSKDQRVISDALDAVSEIRRGDAEWQAQLVTYAADENTEVRNGAVEELGKTRNLDYLPLIIEALDHELWSTRLAAARAIEHMQAPEGVGALALRMKHETGRMAFELADILWNQTGKPYRTNGRLWEKWWQEEGSEFEFITEKDLRKLEKEEEARRLRQITRTEFFGIRIISHRVTFILDVSGSMAETTRGKYVGQKGEPRIDVAKRELNRALDSLDRRSFFNLVVFSNGVESWQDAISELNEETLLDAKEYVDRLTEGGGTNLFGALEFAFEDPDVDTIFVLSDGEPTVGEVTDPSAIRDAVTEWREHRDVTIHCIAVGGSLQVLEWLAEDTGGSYVKFP